MKKRKWSPYIPLWCAQRWYAESRSSLVPRLKLRMFLTALL